MTSSENGAPGLVARAKRYATQAHRRIDHRRKYTGHSYESHLKSVAALVAEVTDDDETIAAAWLHDVVEDTPATVQQIEGEFGAAVAALVADLTDVSKPGDGNRATRKAIDRQHTARATPRAKTVKLADLIDNCQDITRHDPRFGRVFLEEMRALLEILGEGDAELLRRARRLHARSSERLEVGMLQTAPPEPVASLDQSQQHVSRLFLETFTARDIARPLLSFDAERETEGVYSQMREQGREVVGVRRAGMVTAYLRLGADAGLSCGAAAREFSAGEMVDADGSLVDVISVLTRHQYCFVKMLGQVSGVLHRGDINSPVARMWLFGIVSIVEMALTRRVEERYPEGGWSAFVPEGRLAKARTLLTERQRRDRSCSLLDCLQLTDKAGVLIRDGSITDWIGLDSTRTAKMALKEIESLRNHLAHAQDIATHDWAQIARFARRVEEIVHLDYGHGSQNSDTLDDRTKLAG